MKVKTTQSIFSQKDFGISVVSAAASKCFLFAILLFAFSNSGFAQYDNLPDGRNFIVTSNPTAITPKKKAKVLGFTAFSKRVEHAKSQYLYTYDEVRGLGLDSDSISKISFNIENSGQSIFYTKVTIRMGYTLEAAWPYDNNSDLTKHLIKPYDSLELKEVFSGSYTIGTNPINRESENWVDFTLNAPFPIREGGINRNIIVEVSYDYAGPKTGAEVYMLCSQTDHISNAQARGCYSTTEAGENLYTTNSGSFNTSVIPIGAGVANAYGRTQRPWIKFTNVASKENTELATYKTTNSPRIGDPITITPNIYGSGITKFRWMVSSAPSSGFIALNEDMNFYNTPELITHQTAEPMYYQVEVKIGSAIVVASLLADPAEVKGVKTFTNGGWIDNGWGNGNEPVAGESAYIKENNLLWPFSSNVSDLYSIAVADLVTFTVPADKILKVNSILKTADIKGQIVFESSSSFMQTTNQINEPVDVLYKRITQPIYKFDYTYYSSPVKGAVLDSVSPNTLPDKFLSWSPDTNNWFYENKLNLMEPGRGYAIRGPQNLPTVADKTNFNAKFQGTPNNGDIPVTLTNLVGGYNLIGNPYPSAVNAALFTTANSNLEGTIYLWNHNTPIGSVADGMQYSPADYITSNLTGTNEGPNSPIVAAGQSFMIKTASVATPPNTDPVIATWKNQMRIEGENGLNNFYKVQNSNLNTHHVEQASAAGRFWLELKSNSGISQKMLVGYIQGATAGYDRLYDGETISSGALNIYGFADEKYLAILANGLPFNKEEVLPIGFKTGTAGNHTITKFLQDGFFENYAVYINDKLTNTVHNLSESNYTFTSTVGTFNDRFVIAFKIKTTLSDDNSIRTNRVVLFDKYENIQLHSGDDIMSSIEVYDLSGRMLASIENCNSTEIAISKLPRNNQILVVVIFLENGDKEIQKFKF